MKDKGELTQSIERKNRSVKTTLEYIMLVIKLEDSKEVDSRLKNWLESSYDMAKDDGIIETLQRQRIWEK